MTSVRASLGVPNTSLHLPHEIILHILSYLTSWKCALNRIAATSRGFHALLFSRLAADFWDAKPLELCIDEYCPICPFRRSKCYINACIAFLSKCPVRRLKMHCFVTDIPRCLKALSVCGTITNLQLALTHQTTSPPLIDVLVSSSDYSFPALHTLTIDSAHLQVVKLEGRRRLLEILGSQLHTLRFLSQSPPGIFAYLHGLCPRLQHLRIDKLNSQSDLLSYTNTALSTLELRRANFLPRLSHLSHLISFHFCPANRHSAREYARMFQALPAALQSLYIEIPSSEINEVLCDIANLLPQLVVLGIQGSYDRGVVEMDALLQLAEQCTSLQSLQFGAAKNPTVSVKIQPEGLDAISSFISLNHLRLMFEEHILSQNFAGSGNLRIDLWERRKLIVPCEWTRMQKKVSIFNEQADKPLVTMSLQECSMIL